MTTPFWRGFGNGWMVGWPTVGVLLCCMVPYMVPSLFIWWECVLLLPVNVALLWWGIKMWRTAK